MERGMVTDPVCGLEVDPRNARYTSTYRGHTYYFTDPDCKRMFDEDPEAYASMTMEQAPSEGMVASRRGEQAR